MISTGFDLTSFRDYKRILILLEKSFLKIVRAYNLSRAFFEQTEACSSIDTAIKTLIIKFRHYSSTVLDLKMQEASINAAKE